MVLIFARGSNNRYDANCNQQEMVVSTRTVRAWVAPHLRHHSTGDHEPVGVVSELAFGTQIRDQFLEVFR